MIAAGLVLLALLAGITGTTFGLIRAEEAKADADAKRSEAEKQQRRAEAGEKLAGERLIQVEAEKKKAEEEKQVAQAVRDFLQNKLLGPGRHADPGRCLAGGRQVVHGREVQSDDPRTARPRGDSNWPRTRSRRISPNSRFYRPSCSKPLAIPIVAWENTSLAIAFLDARSRAAESPPSGADHPETLMTLNILACAFMAAGKLPQAIGLFEQVRVAGEEVGGRSP